MEQPTGTVTMLFTDIEGSTRLLQQLGDQWPDVLQEHHGYLRAAFDAHGGFVAGLAGDGFFVVFADATKALQAAVDAQRGVSGHAWPLGHEVRVRMGLHTGAVVVSGGEYAGLAVHEAARIAAAAHGGQIVASDATRACADERAGWRWLDLGAHRLKDLDRSIAISQLCVQNLSDDFPPLRSIGVGRRHNLPNPLTSFIGRANEVKNISRLLNENRIVTLVGPGGIGKSRLAIAAAVHVLDEFEDGCWWVELASIVDEGGVAGAIAQAIEVQTSAGTSLASVVDHLSGRKVLLILDNCEHLVEAAAEVAAELTKRCPTITILATSRELLGLDGEAPSWLPPLGTDGDAVRLFVERAEVISPTETLAPGVEADIADICRRLDGLPLAIELAAARTRSMSVREISEGLRDRFRLLTGGGRSRAARQRTLQAAVDWSFDLLSSDEQRLLARTGVFVGGFDREPCRAVCSNDTLPAGRIDDVLDQLIGKSMVVADTRGERTRFALLETIRHYGLDKLVEAGDAEALRDRHLAWCLDASNAADALSRRDDILGMRWVQRERGNIDAAMAWAVEQGRTDDALALAGFAWGNGQLFAGSAVPALQTYERLLAAEPQLQTTNRAKALVGKGVLEANTGSQDCVASFQAAIAMTEQLEYDAEVQWCEAWARLWLAMILGSAGQFDVADGELARGAALTGPFQDEVLAASVPWIGGVLASAKGALHEARSLFEDGMRQAGPMSIANMGIGLGQVLIELDDLDAAAGAYERALASVRDIGGRTDPTVASGLAMISYLRGQLTDAEGWWTESLLALREAGLGASIALAATTLAWLALLRGDTPEAAARRAEAGRHLDVLPPGSLVWSLVLHDEAEVSRADGSTDSARRSMTELLENTDAPHLLLRGSIPFAVDAGDFATAAQLSGAASAHEPPRISRAWTVPTLRRELAEVRTAEVRRELGASAFETWDSVGAGLPLPDAIRLARSVL